MADHIGQQMGPYRLVRLLGQGGFAEVYLGEHVYLDKPAAIKVLHTPAAQDGFEQFRLEAKRIAHLEHPHIVRVFDFGVEDDVPFLVMSYAPGGTLRQRHPRGTRLPLPLIVQYVKQVADALQYAHDRKLIHRDIKPENMLLDENDEIRLSDFGIATIVHRTITERTQEEAMAGTIPYMAPEQIGGKPRPASDQYALGIVVYEWLCGERPFQGSFIEIVGQHVLTPPPPLAEKIPTISPEVEQVVMTALAKDPHQRFGSVQAFALALEQASKGLPTKEIVVDLLSEGETLQLEQASKEPPAEIEPVGQPPPTPSVIDEQMRSPLPTEIDTPASSKAAPTPTTMPPPVSNRVLAEPQPRQRGISRRTVVKGLAALAAASAGTGWLVAYSHSFGGTPTKVSSIDALTVWSGNELDAFKAINAAFTQKTGIRVNVQSTGNLIDDLTKRVNDNNPPSIAVLPSLTLFHRLAAQGKLVPLDSFFNTSQIKQNYAKTWIELASYNGALYAVILKANTKGCIWYNPKQFEANNYKIPKTWDDLIALSDQIASSGKFPWSMGVKVKDGKTSGWPAADWVDQIYLNLYGPDQYEQWVAHQILWTDPSIKNAFQMFGQIVTGKPGKPYVSRAPQSILTTDYRDAFSLLYDTPPKAYLYYLADFTGGFITTQFPHLKSGTDFNFFSFPTINSKYADAVTGTADIMVALRNNDGTRQYMEFMSTADAQSIWVQRGGATSVNQGVDLSIYPNDVARAAAEQLRPVTLFRVGADDLMPPDMETAYWNGILRFIGAPSELDSILRDLEKTAHQVYPQCYHECIRRP